jgi:DNA polymerase-3 subunit alpha/error-prone DNA polymerase
LQIVIRMEIPIAGRFHQSHSGIEGIKSWFSSVPSVLQNKNQLLVIARLILNYKPENRNLMLLQEPVKNTNFPY